MNKKEHEKQLDIELSGHGFWRKTSTWYRQEDVGLQVVNLQKSVYGMQFYLNLGFVPLGMTVEGMPTPKEHKCPVRIRLTGVFPECCDEIEEILNLERDDDIDGSARKQRVSRLIGEMLIPFLDRVKSYVSLKNAIEGGDFRKGAVTLAVQKHFGILAE